MPVLTEQPGLLFVIATLLPLTSFVLLLLLGAVRWGLRPYAKDNPGVDSVYQFLGGAVPGVGPAYCALAAITLAFLCCAAGFSIFLGEIGELHELEHKLQQEKIARATPHGHEDHKDEKGHDDHKEAKKGDKVKDAKDAKDVKAAKKAAKEQHDKDVGRYNQLVQHWEGHIDWARVFPDPKSRRDTTGMKPEVVAELGRNGAILTLGFRIDMLSAIMFMMVTFIASLIHLFSIGYMSDELQKTVEDHEVHTAHGHYERRGRYGRFFMFLSLFCFSMLNLVLADNLFQIFVSWELVGICSYLLIGFYFERTSASNAANKAFITNRIGDAGFVIGLMIVWTYFGTFNFQEIFSQIRCPEVDLHKVIKVNGEPAGHKIIRGNIGPEEGKGYHEVKLAPDGDTALIFPRKPEHFHGPARITIVSNQPTQDDYGYIPYWMLVAAGLGIFIGCMGKSAQFPLQVWLPDAMEGPTPVSALIHAATMVAAGVYLVGRVYPLFTPEVLLTISYVGAITLFVAATVAVVMTDIKKVLAYSTVSQLGYMMLALGVGAWGAGLLHLLTHAFFKALLFLGSGSVIYGCHHQQDMLKMGGLYPKMKITALTMLVGVLAIAGTPFFSGWYSKDEILAGAFGHAFVHKEHFLLFVLPLVTAGITTFYMFRMWFMTFTGQPRDEHVHEHAHESPWMMTAPLVVLAVMSVCVAWGWPLHLPEESWLGQQLHQHSQPKLVQPGHVVAPVEHAEHEEHEEHAHVHMVDVDFVKENQAAHAYSATVGFVALAIVLVGLAFAVVLYYRRDLDPADATEQFPGVHAFLTHKWYFDELYSALIVRPGLTIAHWCRGFDTSVIDGFVNFLARFNLRASFWSGRFDRGIIDGAANLIADVSYAIGAWLRNLQTGYLRSYVLFLALAAMGTGMLLYAWATALGAK